MHAVNSFHRPALLTMLFVCLLSAPARSSEPAELSESERLATAVALNYCRAAFHRIRENPTKEVLVQEEEKILNNLNLNGIEDPEVIRLYTGVLDEIGGIEIADRERVILRDQYRRNVSQKLTWNVLAFGTSLATAQVGSAIKTGADSWWDYRSSTLDRDRGLLRVERLQMTSVVQKSSEFLDTFWKLAQRKQIPDRWLVRGTDLDQLDRAMQEPNAEVRLRILKRMEPFMEAYPPYWYYVARTEQALGNWVTASQTYQRLAGLGGGHFRRDEMLATGLANRAAIEDYLGNDTAVAIAEEALRHSSEVWEANLLCARVLERHEQLAEAEDAILRNLDVGLERQHSRVFQLSLYYHSDQREKLAKLLDDPQIVAELPMSAVVRCAALLGPEETPARVTQLITQSIQGQARVTFGKDDFVLTAAPAWQLHLAKATLVSGGQEVAQADVQYGQTAHLVRFPAPEDWGTPFKANNSPDVTLVLTYPDETSIRVSFGQSTYASSTDRPAPLITSAPIMRLATIDVDDKRLSVHTAAYGPRLEAVPISTSTDTPVDAGS
ncbi:MAG: hypothetical protein AB7U20_15945 [Planctomycetaceae bacterium]